MTKPGQYPTLTNMVMDLSYDNGTDPLLLPEAQWGWPTNAEQLEQQAAKLSKRQREVLVAGEEGQQQRLVKKYGCQELHAFIAAVFDGDLTPKFYSK